MARLSWLITIAWLVCSPRAFVAVTPRAAGRRCHVNVGFSPAVLPLRAPTPRMGVPKFFRWLTERFPQINRRISEGRRADDYVDNFYLDMNGIIHTCTHGEGIPAGLQPSEEAMVDKIFEYTERLIKIANPRKLCYLAIDGVAPRAKMNQQRSRRYRAPREAAQLAAQLAAQGVAQPTGQQFDSNCITPGTEFLNRLGERYKSWIKHKQATDPAWINGPMVVFSGADVVGEGEHKIMQAIRDGRASGAFDEGTRHCMYGLDADLIMLSLVTHAPRFTLLRERQKFQKGRYAPRGGKKMGETSHKASGIADSDTKAEQSSDDRDFVFLEIELLRSLLGASLRPPSAEGGADKTDSVYPGERLVDDFVFLCMLVGNDFLPGLPSLDVADGALNLMLRTYTEMLPTNGFLTDKEVLNLAAFETYARKIAAMEPTVFEKKRSRGAGGVPIGGRFDRRRQRSAGSAAGSDADAYMSDPSLYRKEYYLQKVGLHPKDVEGRQRLVHAYCEGLAWCLAYYHRGCASWDWFYPDFYGPLATDLVDLASLDLRLELGRPFPPLAQLLSVLPPQSSALVPLPYQELMLSPTSPVFDAYPADFVLDLNGKRADWEAIALLPFINQPRLLAAVHAIDQSGKLTEAERARNVLGEDLIYRPSGFVSDGQFELGLKVKAKA